MPFVGVGDHAQGRRVVQKKEQGFWDAKFLLHQTDAVTLGHRCCPKKKGESFSIFGGRGKRIRVRGEMRRRKESEKEKTGTEKQKELKI